MLHEFLTTNTTEIIKRSRAKVASRTAPLPTEDELKNGVPLFLEQLIDRLQMTTTDSVAIEASAATHGGELLAMGFSISQVVRGYGDVCQSITQLADERKADITVDEFQTLNLCLDDAMAFSVTEYERRRDAATASNEIERSGILAHELGNRVTAALVAFKILRKGTVGIGGSTGAVLGRSLQAIQDLVRNSVAGVRLEGGLGKPERVSVAEIIGEVRDEAYAEADLESIKLVVSPPAPGIDVNADRQMLCAAISNLLLNAFKFSCPGGHVSLRATANAERVLIEVEDQCGGLPEGKSEELFQPFAQRGTNRNGLGLGLSISRRSVDSMGGKIAVRDVPGKGCVFSIDLPRMPIA